MQGMMLSGHAARLAIAALSVGLACQSQAQDTRGVSADSDGGTIVVTALRRSSTIQETPISIAAISGEGLAQMGATALPDYFRQIPNLNLTQGQIGISRISIRGINASGEATVGLYFDETPITGPSGTSQDPGANAADLNLFDLERVEVLRGPQGTLYGASSMAGTLRLIFNKPDAKRREAQIESQVSTTKDGSIGYFTRAMINEPIVEDVLALRIAAYHEQRPGYIDNIRYGQSNVNDSTSQGVRALLAFTPNPDMTLTGTVIYQKTEADDQQGWFEPLGDYQTNLSTVLPFNSKLQLYNLTYNWKLPSVTLTATGSYYRYDILRTIDFSPNVNAISQSPAACRGYFNIASACSASQLSDFRQAGLANMPAIGYQPAYLKTKTGELRATSDYKGPLNWTLGVFYENRQDHIDSHVSRANSSTGQVILPLQDLSYRYIDTELTQKAAFGEVSLTPLSGLTLTAGARYYDYKRTTAGEATLASVFTGSVLTPFSSVKAHAKGWLEKFNVSYDVTRDVMLYGTVAKGFRPGGANNIPSLSQSLVIYNPDSLWNYEVGAKTSWLNGALIVNAAIFQIDWQDIQTTARTADGLFGYITNAGAARIRGFEADVTVRPVQGLTLTMAAGHSDAVLTQDQSNSSLQLTGSSGRKGDRLPNVPNWSASASAAYRWPLIGDLDGLIRADYAYTGNIVNGFAPATNPYFESYGDYGSVNARIGLENDRMGFYLFVQNLTNEAGTVGAVSSLGIERQLYSLTPRTIGFNSRFNF